MRLKLPSSHKKYSTTYFTLVEMLFVIITIAILFTILMPSFSGMRKRAIRSSCQSNLKQCAIGISTYAKNNTDRSPSANMNRDLVPVFMSYGESDLRPLLKPYLKRSAWRCPNLSKTPAPDAPANTHQNAAGNYEYLLGRLTGPGNTSYKYPASKYLSNNKSTNPMIKDLLYSIQQSLRFTHGRGVYFDGGTRPSFQHYTGPLVDGVADGFNQANCDGSTKWYDWSERKVVWQVDPFNSFGYYK